MNIKMKKRHLAIILLLLIAAFFIANNNSYIKTMKQNTSKTVLDLKVNATVPYIKAYLEDLNDSGREAYKSFLWKIDMIFPISYSLLFSLILLFIRQRINKAEGFPDFLVFTPYMAGLFDILENFHILTLLKSFPYTGQRIAASLRIMTSIKELFYLMYMVVFIVFMCMRVIQNRKQTKSVNSR